MRSVPRPAFGAAAIALTASCRGIQSSLDTAGAESARIGGLWWLMFWTCAAVFVVVMAVLMVAVLRAPREDADDTVSSRRERRRVVAVSGGIAVTALVLLVFLVATESTGRAVKTPAGPAAIKVEVVGHQWWWEVRYTGDRPDRAVTTANELHLPIGRPVLLELTSRDVIHSFWAPTLHGKKDAIPGRVTTHVIRAEKAGIFRGQCAEFCGLQHAHMAFFVVVEPWSRFETWLAGQRQPAAQPVEEAAQRGQRVFLSAPCPICHTVRGTPASGMVAPDLTHLASRNSIAAGTVPNNPGHLAAWIVDPQSIKPGNNMPPQHLGGDELQALLAYLATLR